MGTGSAALARTRSAMVWACSVPVMGITSTNSSPPRRTRMSTRRVAARTRSTKVRSTWSPTGCPCVSLTCLK